MFGLTRCVTRLQVIKLDLLDFMDSWTSCPAHGDSRKASAGLTRGVLTTLQVCCSYSQLLCKQDPFHLFMSNSDRSGNASHKQKNGRRIGERDNERGYFFFLLTRCMVSLYLWFLLSEITLFMSFFWLIFNFMFFYCDFFGFFIPFYMCYVLFDVFVLFFIFFIDFFNIWVCTLFLVTSGFLTIFCVMLHFCNNFSHLFFVMCFVCCFGFLFSCMQFYEFNNFIVTFSFWPMFDAAFLLDFLHFTHVQLIS